MTSGGVEHRLDGLALEREAELSSSSRSRSMASPSDVSSRSSVVGSSSADLEFDDDGDDTDDEDARYPWPVSEYEEIPSFRWIATPLRWWKKTRSGRRLSKKSAAAATASTSERTRPTEGKELEDSEDETRSAGLTHFDDHPTFTADDLMVASAEVLGKGVHGTSYKATLEVWKTPSQNCVLLNQKGSINGASFSDFNTNEKGMAEDRTGESKSTEGTDATTFGGAVVSPVPSSIDWATVAIEAHLEVPTSPPLINSHPDVTYQRYFRSLYDLAHRSPPVPSSLLEAQLNKMIVGLHSLGYPLDAWVKAATLALVFCKKREFIDYHVDGHKAHVEARLEELTSAMAPIKEEISRSQSHIIDVERKQEDLDEIIAWGGRGQGGAFVH